MQILGLFLCMVCLIDPCTDLSLLKGFGNFKHDCNFPSEYVYLPSRVILVVLGSCQSWIVFARIDSLDFLARDFWPKNRQKMVQNFLKIKKLLSYLSESRTVPSPGRSWTGNGGRMVVKGRLL